MAHLLPRFAKSRRVDYGGRSIKLYTIGWMAYSFQRHPETVKLWEKQGILPLPLLSVKTKWRYYTADEIQAYTSVFLASGIQSGVPADKQSIIGQFQRARKALRAKFQDRPKTLTAELPNEVALLQYASDKLASKASLAPK